MNRMKPDRTSLLSIITLPACLAGRLVLRGPAGFVGVALGFLMLAAAFAASTAVAADVKLTQRNYVMAPPAPKAQTEQQANLKSDGCMSCHTRHIRRS